MHCFTPAASKPKSIKTCKISLNIKELTEILVIDTNCTNRSTVRILAYGAITTSLAHPRISSSGNQRAIYVFN